MWTSGGYDLGDWRETTVMSGLRSGWSLPGNRSSCTEVWFVVITI